MISRNAPKLTSVLCIMLALVLLPLMSMTAWAGGKFDQLNGLWRATLEGEEIAGSVLTESYPEIGFRLSFINGEETSEIDKVFVLTKTAVPSDELVDPLVEPITDFVLTLAEKVGITTALDELQIPGAEKIIVRLVTEGQTTKNPRDDRIVGDFFGEELVLKRDMRDHPPIEIHMPGDRPWVRFMQEILIPKTAEDRETFHRFKPRKAGRFLRKCQLYRTGYWQKNYMKGENRKEQSRSFHGIIYGMKNNLISPRSVMYSGFRNGLNEFLSDATKETKFGLAASGLGMYFTTAAGGAVRIIVTDNRDSIIYYITDTRRTSKLGLVVMDTPAHAPLASSFGKWQLDLGEMPLSDDAPFGRALIETLAKSSSASANELSDIGKSAYCDYLGVMAIEDQRGVMFNNAGLKWGLNMTNCSFVSLIARALSHGEFRAGPVVKGREWLGFDGSEELDTQVIVESFMTGTPELRPGDPSYFDTLNGANNVIEPPHNIKGGSNLIEGRGPARLKKLTTRWLRSVNPEAVKRVEAAFAVVGPLEQISQPMRASEDIFHLMSDYFYEPEMAKVTPAQATEMVEAGVDLLSIVTEKSRSLEEFILANGVTKSSEWAPRASGF